MLGETPAVPATAGETLYEKDGVRLWTLPAVDAGIGIVSFKSKAHAIGAEVVAGLLAAIERAEDGLSGLVIWHAAPFAVGANRAQVAEA